MTAGAPDTFVHEALLYRDEDEFVAGTSRFLAAGLALGEPAMAAVPQPRLALLEAALADQAERVRFVDMSELGANPSRILPEIAAFLAEHDGERVRFIGEPSWPGRRTCEAIEAARHEALINHAFAGADAAILCPYDAAELPADRLADAERTHPVMVCGHERRASTAYTDPLEVWAAADRPFDRPAAPLARFVVEGDVGDVRRAIRAHGAEAGLDRARLGEFLVAASEAATNALLHARPPVTVTLWLDEDEVVCDVTDHGRFADPLAGRRRPSLEATGGRGLWIINQLCDLTEIRSGPAGTTARLRMRRSHCPPG